VALVASADTVVVEVVQTVVDTFVVVEDIGLVFGTGMLVVAVVVRVEDTAIVLALIRLFLPNHQVTTVAVYV
jgi:hypothetical protein